MGNLNSTTDTKNPQDIIIEPHQLNWINADIDFEDAFNAGEYDKIIETINANIVTYQKLEREKQEKEKYKHNKFGKVLIKYFLRAIPTTRDKAIFEIGKLAGYIEILEYQQVLKSSNNHSPIQSSKNPKQKSNPNKTDKSEV